MHARSFVHTYSESQLTQVVCETGKYACKEIRSKLRARMTAIRRREFTSESAAEHLSAQLLAPDFLTR